MRAPIFIVGHWRSGTTYLYNVLSQSPEFAYVTPLATGMPWDFLALASFIRPILERALPSDRFIDQVQVNPDSPQEDEIGLANMQPISFYHGLYFPQKFQQHFNAGIFFDDCSQAQIETWQQAISYFFTKLHLHQPGKRLLIKNPVYTARIAMLRSMWPDAKFIHIHRNPYIVFQSSRNFYRALFQELALQPFDLAASDEIILKSYPRMMNALFKETASLPTNQFVEVRFEDFEAEPIDQIARIYKTLELNSFAAARTAFKSYLAAQGKYRKNRYQFSSAANQQVQQYWQPFIDRWHYQPPA
ncbi:MAG: sulfotransferase [Cyanothece sp. SIO1E1]|nr:sulfotransferase [Cyanothece sp. SIO1E1]